MNLRFSETESAFDYMLATREYLDAHGKQTHRILQRQTLHISSESGETQTSWPNPIRARAERAGDRAYFCQQLLSKGRVELANVWLPYFVADFNHRFAKPALLIV